MRKAGKKKEIVSPTLPVLYHYRTDPLSASISDYFPQL
jgi:hypothetical protein